MEGRKGEERRERCVVLAIKELKENVSRMLHSIDIV